MITALVSDETLDRFAEGAYSGAATYRPGGTYSREFLFPWEEEALRDFFPQPPARILIGGAGSGREVFALAKLGYQIVAFEPADELVKRMALRIDSGMGVEVFRGRYEDLPTLYDGDIGVDLASLGRFDAVILGWGSFSYLRKVEDRRHTLATCSQATHGPVLVSFTDVAGDPAEPRSWLGRWRHQRMLRLGRHPQDFFSLSMGYIHPVSEAEVLTLCEESGLQVRKMDLSPESAMAPYAVIASHA